MFRKLSQNLFEAFGYVLNLVKYKIHNMTFSKPYQILVNLNSGGLWTIKTRKIKLDVIFLYYNDLVWNFECLFFFLHVRFEFRPMSWDFAWQNKPYLMRECFSVTGNHFRSSPPEVFLRTGVLKICSKFTGEQRLHFDMGVLL